MRIYYRPDLPIHTCFSLLDYSANIFAREMTRHKPEKVSTMIPKSATVPNQSHRIQVKPTLMTLARGNTADFLMTSQAENLSRAKSVFVTNFNVFN